MNKFFAIGNLTADPELRTTKDGKPLCTFSIAVNRRNSDTADFFRVVTFSGLAENCGKYLVKGKKVAVTGEMRVEQYEKDGQKRTSVSIMAYEVEFLSRLEKPAEDKPDDFLSQLSDYNGALPF